MIDRAQRCPQSDRIDCNVAIVAQIVPETNDPEQPGSRTGAGRSVSRNAGVALKPYRLATSASGKLSMIHIPSSATAGRAIVVNTAIECKETAHE